MLPFHVLRPSLRHGIACLIDCLLPPVCAACGRALPAASGHAVCGDCWCTLAGQAPAPFDIDGLEIRAAFDHRGPGRALIHAFKYNGRRDVAEVVAALAVAGYRRHGQPACDLVVPIPLHRRRLLRRGYNQSRLLATALAARLSLRADDALRRRYATRTQTRLGAAARRENVAAAIAPPARWIGRLPQALAWRGARVLLVDDVVTTGATLSAAADALRRMGVRSIVVQVGARAPLE